MKTFYSVKFRNWGADGCGIAWFDNIFEAKHFASKDYRDNVVVHNIKNKEKIRHIESMLPNRRYSLVGTNSLYDITHFLDGQNHLETFAEAMDYAKSSYDVDGLVSGETISIIVETYNYYCDTWEFDSSWIVKRNGKVFIEA